MGKGEATRQAILEHAFAQAARVGLDGLSIGQLAQELSLSKSGLFAHFQSKEALQIEVVEAAAARFTDLVVRPALQAPRGLARVRALMDRWFEWGRASTPAGCFFVAAAAELDDRPGPARDRLVARQNDWLDLLASTIRAAIREGQLRPELDPEQVAFELYGIVLSWHHHARLLGVADAETRARRAIDRLLGVAWT